MRCHVVEWKPGCDFPIDEVNRGMVATDNGHNTPFLGRVETGDPERFAIVIAPKPIAPPVVARVWGEYLEHGEANPVEIALQTTHS